MHMILIQDSGRGKTQRGCGIRSLLYCGLVTFTFLHPALGLGEPPGSAPDAQARRISTLIDAFNSRDFNVHRDAASQLIRMGPAAKEAVPAMITALSDPDSYHRMSAATVLGSIGPDAKAATPDLIGILRGERETLPLHRRMAVRSEAARALGKIGSVEAVPVLIEALTDENSVVRNSTIDALGRFGPAAEGAIPALIKVVKGEDSQGNANHAADALARIGPAAAPALYQEMRREEGGVRRFAEEVLKQISPPWVFLGILQVRMIPGIMLSPPALVLILVMILVIYILIDYLVKRRIHSGGVWVRVRKCKIYVSMIVLAYLSLQVALSWREFTKLFLYGFPSYLILSVIPLGAIGILMFYTKPNQKTARVSLYLLNFLWLQVVVVIVTHILLPGGHPSLAAVLVGLFGWADVLILPLGVILLGTAAFTGETKRYVLCGAIYVVLLIGAHPFVDVEGVLEWGMRKFTPLHVRLGSGDSQVMVDAVGELRGLDNTEKKRVVATLVEDLKFGDRAVRLRAARALGLMREDGEDAVPVLIEVMKKDESPGVRQAAQTAIGYMGPGAAPAVIEAFKNKFEDKSIRRNLLWTLGSLNPPAPETIPVLIEALQEEDEDFRVVAAGADIRIAAVGVLGGMGPMAKDAVPSLIPLLRADSRVVRGNVAIALGRIGPSAEEAVPSLILLLDDADEFVRKQAATALGRIRTAEAVDALMRRDLLK